MAEAEAGASGPAFQRSARLRAFARCMGDNMSESNAGFANPFSTPSGGVAAPTGAAETEVLIEAF